MSEIHSQSDNNINIVNNYLCKQISYNKTSLNLKINEVFKIINLLKKELEEIYIKNNLENIMKIKIKINHYNIILDKMIYHSENNFNSLDDFVKKNKIKFRVLIHIFKHQIQTYFIKNKIKNYLDQLLLDTVNAVIDKQLEMAPSISNYVFYQLIDNLCSILSQIKYSGNLQKKIEHTESTILKYPLFVGGNRNIYTINYINYNTKEN